MCSGENRGVECDMRGRCGRGEQATTREGSREVRLGLMCAGREWGLYWAGRREALEAFIQITHRKIDPRLFQ